MKCNPKLFDLIGRIIVPIPSIIISVYMVAINANSFWLKIAGPTLLSLGLFFLIFSLLLCFTSFLLFFAKTEKIAQILNGLYQVLSFFTLVIIGIILYYTSLRKELESDFWIEKYIMSNSNSQIVQQFLDKYRTTEEINLFVRQHTFQYHDILFFITLISIVLHFFLVHLSEKMYNFLFNKAKANTLFDMDRIPIIANLLLEKDFVDYENLGGDKQLTPIVLDDNEKVPLINKAKNTGRNNKQTESKPKKAKNIQYKKINDTEKLDDDKSGKNLLETSGKEQNITEDNKFKEGKHQSENEKIIHEKQESANKHEEDMIDNDMVVEDPEISLVEKPPVITTQQKEKKKKHANDGFATSDDDDEIEKKKSDIFASSSPEPKKKDDIWADSVSEHNKKKDDDIWDDDDDESDDNKKNTKDDMWADEDSDANDKTQKKDDIWANEDSDDNNNTQKKDDMWADDNSDDQKSNTKNNDDMWADTDDGSNNTKSKNENVWADEESEKSPQKKNDDIWDDDSTHDNKSKNTKHARKKGPGNSFAAQRPQSSRRVRKDNSQGQLSLKNEKNDRKKSSNDNFTDVTESYNEMPSQNFSDFGDNAKEITLNKKAENAAFDDESSDFSKSLIAGKTKNTKKAPPKKAMPKKSSTQKDNFDDFDAPNHSPQKHKVQFSDFDESPKKQPSKRTSSFKNKADDFDDFDEPSQPKQPQPEFSDFDESPAKQKPLNKKPSTKKGPIKKKKPDPFDDFDEPDEKPVQGNNTIDFDDFDDEPKKPIKKSPTKKSVKKNINDSFDDFDAPDPPKKQSNQFDDFDDFDESPPKKKPIKRSSVKKSPAKKKVDDPFDDFDEPDIQKKQEQKFDDFDDFDDSPQKKKPAPKKPVKKKANDPFDDFDEPDPPKKQPTKFDDFDDFDESPPKKQLVKKNLPKKKANDTFDDFDAPDPPKKPLQKKKLHDPFDDFDEPDGKSQPKESFKDPFDDFDEPASKPNKAKRPIAQKSKNNNPFKGQEVLKQKPRVQFDDFDDFDNTPKKKNFKKNAAAASATFTKSSDRIPKNMTKKSILQNDQFDDDDLAPAARKQSNIARNRSKDRFKNPPTEKTSQAKKVVNKKNDPFESSDIQLPEFSDFDEPKKPAKRQQPKNLPSSKPKVPTLHNDLDDELAMFDVGPVSQQPLFGNKDKFSFDFGNNKKSQPFNNTGNVEDDIASLLGTDGL